MSTSQLTFSRPRLPDLPPGKSSLLTRTPFPTPTYTDASSLSFSVIARTPIAASSTTVLRALLDPANWPRWNTFIPGTTVHSPGTPTFCLPDAGLLGVGAKFTMYVNMTGKSALERGPVEKLQRSSQHLSIVEKLVPAREEGRSGYRIVWCYDAPAAQGWMMKAERVQEVVQTEGGCEYVTWESFGGWMAPAVRMMVGGNLVERFGDWGRDLAGWCEGEGGAGSR